MKKIFMVMVIGIFFMVFTTSLYAAGTAAEAEAMVKKAATFLKAQGKDKAFKEFTEGTQFKKEDLYIFVIDVNGMTLAHGGNPRLVGKDMSGLKDADGKLFIKEMADAAKAKGSGWADYKWTNPTTKKIDNKSTYFQKMDNMVIGCGIYKK
ncbi:MAG: cache domain-containing protein [Syntrophorhabdaceae bacterium]|jgi:signal transduction histidine kinase|nr:cache domain-containing protein [Syntrophorhabdaceae bacterium]MDD5245152.1 cache domain-containing protein [Syntrophorhabdaceae bacterium]